MTSKQRTTRANDIIIGGKWRHAFVDVCFASIFHFRIIIKNAVIHTQVWVMTFLYKTIRNIIVSVRSNFIKPGSDGRQASLSRPDFHSFSPLVSRLNQALRIHRFRLSGKIGAKIVFFSFFFKSKIRSLPYFLLHSRIIIWGSDGLAVRSLSRIPKVRGSNPSLGTLGNVSENQFPGSTQAFWGNMGRWQDHRKVPLQWDVTLSLVYIDMVYGCTSSLS